MVLRESQLQRSLARRLGNMTALLLLFTLALAGCDGAAGPLGGSQGNAADEPAVAPSPPTSLTPGTLALYPKLEDDETKVRVGDKVMADAGVFESPGKGIVATPLPKGLAKEEFAATGWELGDGTRGAGFISILRSREIVAAIVRETADTTDDAQAIIDGYKKKFPLIDPNTKVIGADNYTFWEEGDNRLMILESPGKKGAVQLTLALGVKPILNFLRADPIHAQLDASRANLPTAPTKSEPSGNK